MKDNKLDKELFELWNSVNKGLMNSSYKKAKYWVECRETLFKVLRLVKEERKNG